jgi:hypothetical protein
MPAVAALSSTNFFIWNYARSHVQLKRSLLPCPILHRISRRVDQRRSPASPGTAFLALDVELPTRQSIGHCRSATGTDLSGFRLMSCWTSIKILQIRSPLNFMGESEEFIFFAYWILIVFFCGKQGSHDWTWKRLHAPLIEPKGRLQACYLIRFKFIYILLRILLNFQVPLWILEMLSLQFLWYALSFSTPIALWSMEMFIYQ